MKIGREELQAAVKLAAHFATDHSIASFTKVWLLEDRVCSFNGQIGAEIVLEGLPNIGGLDGKVLSKLLDSSSDDEIELKVNENNELALTEGRSKATLHVMDNTAHIESAPKSVAKDALFQVPMVALEDVQMPALLTLNDLKNDPVPDLASMSIWPGDDKLTIFTSDRVTLRRNYWSIGSGEHASVKAPIYIPLNFMKAIGKLWHDVNDGDLVFTDRHALVQNQDAGITLYTKLIHVEAPLNFKGWVTNCWPDGVFNKKLLVPIPDRLRDAVTKAVTLNQDRSAAISLRVIDGELAVKAEGPAGKFTDTMKIKGHANIDTKVGLYPLHVLLPQTERMFMGHRATALFGPLRFAAFVANK